MSIVTIRIFLLDLKKINGRKSMLHKQLNNKAIFLKSIDM